MNALPPTLLLLSCLLAATALGAGIGACLCHLRLARRESAADAAAVGARASSAADAFVEGAGDRAALERRLREQSQRIVALEAELYTRRGRRVSRPGGRAATPRAGPTIDDGALPVLERRARR